MQLSFESKTKALIGQRDSKILKGDKRMKKQHWITLQKYQAWGRL